MISLSFSQILMLMFSAIIAENFIFSKLYGASPFFKVSETPIKALGMGIVTTVAITLSSALTWIVYHLILVPLGLSHLKTMAFILVIVAIVQLIELILGRFIPALYASLGAYTLFIVTNCAVLGCALLNIQNNFNFITSVCYGFAASIGFTLAVVIFAGVRARIEFATPPRAFKGFPLMLIAAALLAMAFSGFSGIKL